MLNKNQKDQLLKPLNPSRVATRNQAGRNLSYLETWDVKAHLIRIFGFGGWSWDVRTAELAFEEKNEKGQWNVGYKVAGTLYIPCLHCNYTEAAVGSATLPQRGEAHDMAIKSGESDALKRAAINLGTQFGLSLYKKGTLEDVVISTLDKEVSSE
jgi:recombination DNA repair RAD52 pathway protein